MIEIKKQWLRGCCFYSKLPLRPAFTGVFAAKLFLICCDKICCCSDTGRSLKLDGLLGGGVALVRKIWGVSRDGGDEASNYPVEPSRPSRFLILWLALDEKKAGLLPPHVSDLALLVQTDAAILT